MTDDSPDQSLEQRTWAVFERALDDAIAADVGDVASLELGVRVAELLLNSRVVSPPLARASDADAAPGEEISSRLLRTDALSLELGADLAALADPASEDGDLLERLRHVRRRIATEFGVIAPGVRVRPNPGLANNEYDIRVHGDSVARGEVLVGLYMGTGQDLAVPGIESEFTTDPIYGSSAIWIRPEDVSAAESHGLQTFHAEDVVATHVAEVVKHHLGDLLGREEVAELLNIARQDFPMVVQELVPNMLSLGQLRQVLRELVEEQVPIKSMGLVLNSLADNAVYTKDPKALAERVREALGRKLCARYETSDGTLKVFMLSPDAERAVQNSIQLNETGQVLMLDPSTSHAIQNNLAEALQRHKGQFQHPVLVCPPKIRRHVKALLDRNFAGIVVLSFGEIVAGIQLDNLEVIEPFEPGKRPAPAVKAGASETGPGPAGASDVDHGDAQGWNW